MKKLFNIKQQPLAIDSILLLARLTIGGLMLAHGLPKLEMLLSGGPIQFPPVLGMEPTIALSLTIFAEVFCSILLIAGFGTRLAVVPLIITMLVAVIYIHPGEFGKQELGLHYLLTYTMLLIAGSGRFSIDYLLTRNEETSIYKTKTARA